METSVKIKEATKRQLNLMKYKLGYKSIDEVIQLLIKISMKIKKEEK